METSQIQSGGSQLSFFAVRLAGYSPINQTSNRAYQLILRLVPALKLKNK